MSVLFKYKPLQSPPPNHILYGPHTSGHYLPALITGPGTRQQRAALMLQSPLKLFTLANPKPVSPASVPPASCLFLFVETTIKAPVHNSSPAFCLLIHPGASRCGSLGHGNSYPPLGNWITNYLFIGNLLILLYLRFSVNTLYFKIVDCWFIF